MEYDLLVVLSLDHAHREAGWSREERRYILAENRLGLCGHYHGAITDRAHGQGEMTQVLGNRDLICVFRSDLQRDSAWHAPRLGCSRRLCSLGNVLIHGNDPDIAKHGFACDPLTNGSASFPVLRQNHIDPVARPDQPGYATCRIHTDRYRARPGL